MALERLDEGLWVAAAPQTFLGIELGSRMTECASLGVASSYTRWCP